MKRIDIARRAGRSLRQAKVRTILTSLAIAVGAFTLTVSLAAGEGSRQYTEKLIGSNVNPQALFIVKDGAVFGEGSGQQTTGAQEYSEDTASSTDGQGTEQLTQKDIEALQNRSDLEAVQPIYQVRFKYFTIEGSSKQYTSELTTYDSGLRNETAAGTLPELGGELDDNLIVVPEQFSETLGMSPQEMLGKKVTLTLERPAAAPSDAEIQDILATEGPDGLKNLSSGETKMEEFRIGAVSKQSSTALNATSAMAVSPNKARELSEFMTKNTDNYQKYFGATARAVEGKNPAEVKKGIEAAGYSAQTAQDLQALLFTIVDTLQYIVFGFGIIALIASVFGIINTQYISVLERTQQIGLMKALGMRGRDVSKLFRYEAAWIGLLGGIIGAGGAVLLGTVLNPWITEQLSLGEGNYLLIFQPLSIVILLLSLMIIAVMAGYFPARKAAKLDPIEALRTE